MNKIKSMLISSVATFLTFFLLVSAAQADVAVVVGAGSGVSSISARDAKKIFLGKTKKLPDGSDAAPVYQPDASATHAAFRDKVLRKSASQLKSYWSKKVFSGKGTPPKEMADDAAVKAYVSSTAGGIGYIDAAAVDGSVKVLLTVK